LPWIEAVTLISETHVPDAVCDQTRQHLSETELISLTLCVAAINAWSRIAISFRAIHPTDWKGRIEETTKGEWRLLGSARFRRSNRARARRRRGTGPPRLLRARKKGISRFDLRDPYHIAVSLTWPQFLVVLLALYLSVNVIFATLYWLVPGSVGNARPNSFADVFFFSIETVATVGYGEMFPATLYGHVVAAIEIICGLAFTAILTGPTFIRFSRPRAKLVFAANPVGAMHNGKPTLMVRIGNGRAAVLMDSIAKLNVFFLDTTAEGTTCRRAQELRLERAHIPIFTIFWTLMHVRDERSPSHGYDRARAIETDARVFVTLEARDPTLATVVQDVRYYAPQDIRFGMRYADTVTARSGRTMVADLSRIGAVEPDVGDRQEPGWTEREETE
jgi:inward rectifier potassium channel